MLINYAIHFMVCKARVITHSGPAEKEDASPDHFRIIALGVTVIAKALVTIMP